MCLKNYCPFFISVILHLHLLHKYMFSELVESLHHKAGILSH
jgi:hypothetical protein